MEEMKMISLDTLKGIDLNNDHTLFIGQNKRNGMYLGEIRDEKMEIVSAIVCDVQSNIISWAREKGYTPIDGMFA